jgi:glycosyltransferase involved in cell wall biosynthesis
MVRILHVTPAYYPATYWGGPIFSVLGLNEALAAIPGVHLRVLTTDSAGPKLAQRLLNGGNGPLSYAPGYDVQFSRRLAGADIAPGLLTRLVPLARWADVIHLTATYSFPTIPTLLVARLLDRPIVWSPRGALQASYEWAGARRRIVKRIWERTCNKIVAGQRCVLHVTSEVERHASLQLIPAAGAEVIPNGIEVPEHEPQRSWRPDGRLRLLFLGRLDRKKGLENLLDALTRLRNSRVSLEVCGTGDAIYVESLRMRVASLALEEMVTFSGHVDGDRKSDAFSRADVCVIPSHSENFCMVVAESLARGVPVIASTGTPWSALADQKAGYWVPNDPESLALALTRIQGEDLELMGSRGKNWMRNTFGWGEIGKQMHALYGRLLGTQLP